MSNRISLSQRFQTNYLNKIHITITRFQLNQEGEFAKKTSLIFLNDSLAGLIVKDIEQITKRLCHIQRNHSHLRRKDQMRSLVKYHFLREELELHTSKAQGQNRNQIHYCISSAHPNLSKQTCSLTSSCRQLRKLRMKTDRTSDWSTCQYSLKQLLCSTMAWLTSTWSARFGSRLVKTSKSP